MKLRKWSSIIFIGFGIITVISSISSIDATIIPQPFQSLLGGLLIIFGLSQLLFNSDHPAKKQKWTIALLGVGCVIVFALAGYWYTRHLGSARQDHMVKSGTFELKLDSRTYYGEAQLEGKKLLLQIKAVPSDLKIDEFILYRKGVELDGKTIFMVCALKSDRIIARCSSDLQLPGKEGEVFIDNGFYTIQYLLFEPLDDTKISDISFSILSEEVGSPLITIRENS